VKIKEWYHNLTVSIVNAEKGKALEDIYADVQLVQ
jgi:hypothetical protein